MAKYINFIKNFSLSFFAKLRNDGISWYVIFYLTVLYYSTFLNAQILSHFYRILDDSNEDSIIFKCTPPLVLFSALSIVFLVFSFRYVFKTVLPILIIIGSITGHFSYNYGIIFDYDMMINLLSTNVGEAKSYISFDSIYNSIVYGFIPASFIILVKIKWPKTIIRGLFGRLAIFIIAVATFIAIAVPYYQNYASIGRNNNILRKEISPYNFVWFGYKAIYNTYFATPMKFDAFAKDSIIDNLEERPELFVVVLGETARAQNYPQNGYDRNTTIYTQDLENLTTYKPVTTCGTATAVSVPCMFSIMNRSNYDEKKAYHSSSLVDILKYAGYKTMWYDNDGGCKGVCDRTENEAIAPFLDENKQFCDGETCYDEILVKKLQKRLKTAVAKKQSTVVFLHLIGSHGPTYYKRVPDDKKLFKPSCERGDIENCSVEEIRNSYDNTISYTDFVLKQVVESLKPYEKDFGTAMVYMSDHGESLGEGGLFLHSTPYALAPEYQTRVPFITWFSNSFIEDHKMNMKCQNEKAKTQSFSQDNFYHSLLGILDVNTSFYNKNLDLFNSCRVWNKSKR